jgi:hypothetical protein
VLRVQGLVVELMAQSLGFRVWGLEFKVKLYGSWFTGHTSGFRVESLESSRA